MIVRTDLYATGRKHCSMCRRWRPVHEFGLVALTGRQAGYLRSRCRTCDRVDARIRNGIRDRGRPYEARDRKRTHCKRGHALVGDNLYTDPSGKHHCRVCRRAAQRTDSYREYSRIWQEARRRSLGAPSRIGGRATPRRSRERTTLPTGPFARWLVDLKAREGATKAAAVTWMNSRTIDAYINGERPTVHIDTVDAALMHEGSTFLWELYPALYDFEDEAVAA